jgi:DNA-directed RNA polymerase subunit E'/Rpb7
LVIWPFDAGVQKVVIELKLLHKSLEKTIAEGLEQTAGYMGRCDASEGHLVIFDRTPERPWEEKIFRRSGAFGEREIAVWGM